MEVTVEHNIEKAMKILKRKLIKEGLFKELKSRRYYEKPSERRKRKHKESVKKIRKEESRAKKNSLLAS
ncbi:MAG: 30S ribosomal protein S21 [Deltaproteobacteria bacterium]|nr:30S ribosomal protein S21 [Deltaproteobacteria bacterium]